MIREKKINSIDLLRGNILMGIVLFAIPILLSNVFQQLYNAVDTMIIGNCLGDASLAAVGACASIFELLVGFEQGIGNGFGIIVAIAFGSGDQKRLRRAVAGSIEIGTMITLVVTILMKLVMRPLLQILDTPAEIIEEAYAYIIIIALFVGVMFAYNLLSAVLRSIGNSVVPVLFLVFSALVNTGLDLLFIARMGMGVRGGAIATVIAQGLSAVLCLFYILLYEREIVPQKEDWLISKELAADLFTQGISMGFMSGIVSSGSIILQSAINGLGTLVIAGHTAARKIFIIANVPVFSVSTAVATLVSQNRGAGNKDRIRKGIRYANGLSILWAVIVTLLMVFGARSMVALISGSTQKALLDYGKWYLIVAAPFYSVLGILITLRMSIQGLGYKVIPLISSIIELLGKIVFTWLLIPVLGAWGVIFCEPVIWCVMCAQLVWSYLHNPYLRRK